MWSADSVGADGLGVSEAAPPADAVECFARDNCLDSRGQPAPVSMDLAQRAPLHSLPDAPPRSPGICHDGAISNGECTHHADNCDDDGGYNGTVMPLMPSLSTMTHYE